MHFSSNPHNLHPNSNPNGLFISYLTTFDLELLKETSNMELVSPAKDVGRDLGRKEKVRESEQT